MYEKFLDKSLNSTRQTVDDTFIAKYANAVSRKNNRTLERSWTWNVL